MAYPRRNSRTPRSRFTIALLLLTAVTLLVLDLPGTGPLDPVRNAFGAAFGPFRAAGSAVFEPLSNGWKGAFGYGDLKDENDRLKAQIEEQKGDQAELDRLSAQRSAAQAKLAAARPAAPAPAAPAAAPGATPVAAAAPNLVFTGTFTPAQSLDMVLRAVLDARAAGAENLHLLLVGDGMSRESLQALAEELHAGDAVTFYGSVPAEKVPSFTTLADALLISLSDSPDLGLTVPGKLASYMAAGKPVVASMNGAGYEAVKESGGGLVSPACDQAALAANLLALYRMASEGRAALGAKAKAYYEAHYRRTELLRRLESFTLRGE